MMNKIREKKGFSISEMLMVVLILGLIILIMGGGVMVVRNAYERITLKAEAQTLLSTTITKVTDEFRFAKYIDTADAAAPVKFTSGNLGYEIWFTNGNGDEDSGNRGILVSNSTGHSVQLLTDRTMTSRLTPELTYSYDENQELFTAKIIIRHGSTEYLSQEIKVKPIN